MVKKRFFSVLAAAAAAVFALAGCKQNVGTPEDNAVAVEEDGEETGNQDRLFGFACADLSDPFYAVLKDSVAAALEESGDRILVRDAGGDAGVQEAQLDEMAGAGVEAVFLNPVPSLEEETALHALDEAGIPVVSLEADGEGTVPADAVILSDDYHAGAVCGEDLTGKLPEGGRLVIAEWQQEGRTDESITGFEETIADAGFEVAERVEVSGDGTGAGQRVKALLQGDGGVDAVMCGDDRIALDVLQALEEAGENSVLVYSVGGSPDVKSRLAEPGSPMTGVGAASPINMGKAAVKTADAILEEGVYDTETCVETFLIDKNNVELYGTDGWQ